MTGPNWTLIGKCAHRGPRSEDHHPCVWKRKLQSYLHGINDWQRKLLKWLQKVVSIPKIDKKRVKHQTLPTKARSYTPSLAIKRYNTGFSPQSFTASSKRPLLRTFQYGSKKMVCQASHKPATSRTVTSLVWKCYSQWSKWDWPTSRESEDKNDSGLWLRMVFDSDQKRIYNRNGRYGKAQQPARLSTKFRP